MSIKELAAEEIQDWLTAGQECLRKAGFEPDTAPWWKHGPSGLYAVIDDYATMPLGGRYIGLYSHRLDASGKDFMAGLVMVPWYGDGYEKGSAVMMLTLVLGDLK